MPNFVKFSSLLLVGGLLFGVVQGVAIPGAAASGGSDHGSTVTVIVTTQAGNPGGRSRQGSASSGGAGERNVYVCTYTVAPPSMTVGLMTGGPEAGQFYIVSCTGPGLGSGQSAIIWLADLPVGASTGVTPTAVAERAASSITLPGPEIRTDPSTTAVVNLPTWLWVDRSVWHAWKATATLAGMSAIATATPVSVTFDTGDGGHVVCDGPGIPYEPGDSSSSQSTYCSHTYSVSSAGQVAADGNPDDATYQVTATITWDVTWRGVGFVGGGSLPSLTTTSTASLRVEQIESVQQP